MYTDFMMFFTYGCLVRDDLIKKFKLSDDFSARWTKLLNELIEITHNSEMRDNSL